MVSSMVVVSNAIGLLPKKIAFFNKHQVAAIHSMQKQRQVGLNDNLRFTSHRRGKTPQAITTDNAPTQVIKYPAN